MPDNATIVKGWLRARRGNYFCHKCISEGSGVTPVNQVNQLIRPLENTGGFRYMQTTCSNCGKDAKCAGYFG